MGLTKLKREPGTVREIILSHDQPHHAVRLVQVETGGVDRETGESNHVFYEVTVKVPRETEITRTFTSERNARIAYLMAQYGISDFSTPLGDIGPRLWPEPKNLTALWRLAGGKEARQTRINSGDSEPDSHLEAGAAVLPSVDVLEAV